MVAGASQQISPFRSGCELSQRALAATVEASSFQLALWHCDRGGMASSGSVPIGRALSPLASSGVRVFCGGRASVLAARDLCASCLEIDPVVRACVPFSCHAALRRTFRISCVLRTGCVSLLSLGASALCSVTSRRSAMRRGSDVGCRDVRLPGAGGRDHDAATFSGNGIVSANARRRSDRNAPVIEWPSGGGRLTLQPKPSYLLSRPSLERNEIDNRDNSPKVPGRIHDCAPDERTQWPAGVGAFINSTNILLNLARSNSIWISIGRAPSFGLSLSVHVSVFP